MEAEREQGKFKKRSMKKDYSTHLIPEHHQLRLTERNAFYALLVQAKKSISYFDCTQASEEAIITASERLEAFARPYQKNGEKLDAVMEDLARQAHPNSRPPLTLSDMLDAAHETFIGHRNEPSQIMPLIHQLDIDPAHMTISNLPLARDLSQQTADNKQSTAAAGTTRYIPKIALALSALYENGMSADQHLHYILTDKKSKDPLSGHKDKYIVISAPDLKIQLAICERVDAPTYVNRTLRDYTWWQQAAQGQIKTFDELPTIPAHLTAQGWTRALNAFLETPAEPAPTNPPPPTAVPEGTAARFSLRAIIDESMAATLQAHPPVLPRQPLRKKKALPPQLAQPSQQPPHLARPAMLSPASLAPHADLNRQRTQSPPISLRRMIDESIVEAMKTHTIPGIPTKPVTPAPQITGPIPTVLRSTPEQDQQPTPKHPTSTPDSDRHIKRPRKISITESEIQERAAAIDDLIFKYMDAGKLPSIYRAGLSTAEKKELTSAQNFLAHHKGSTLPLRMQHLLQNAAHHHPTGRGPSKKYPALTWARVTDVLAAGTSDERCSKPLFNLLNLHGPVLPKNKRATKERQKQRSINQARAQSKKMAKINQQIMSFLDEGKIPFLSQSNNPQHEKWLEATNSHLMKQQGVSLQDYTYALLRKTALSSPTQQGPSAAHPTLTWDKIDQLLKTDPALPHKTTLFDVLELQGPRLPPKTRPQSDVEQISPTQQRLQEIDQLIWNDLARKRFPSPNRPSISEHDRKLLLSADMYLHRRHNSSLATRTYDLLHKAAQDRPHLDAPNPKYQKLTWGVVDKVLLSRPSARYRLSLFDVLQLHGPQQPQAPISPLRLAMNGAEKLRQIDMLIFNTLAKGKLPVIQNPKLSHLQRQHLTDAADILRDTGRHTLSSYMGILFRRAAATQPSAQGPSPAHPNLTWAKISDILTEQSPERPRLRLFKLLDLQGPPAPKKTQNTRIFMSRDDRLRFTDQLIWNTLANGFMPSATNQLLPRSEQLVLRSANAFLIEKVHTNLSTRLGTLLRQALTDRPDASGPSPAHPHLTWEKTFDTIRAQSHYSQRNRLFRLLDLPGPPEPKPSSLPHIKREKQREYHQRLKAQKKQMG